MTEWEPIDKLADAERFEAARAELLKKGMTERQVEVVLLHDAFGLSFAEIGRRWNISRTRVQQIHQEAKRKLAVPWRRRIVSKYFA